MFNYHMSILINYRKIEMEAKRKMEELERKRQEDEDLRAAVALQVIS